MATVDDRHIGRMAAGNHEAFKELFEAWHGRLLLYAWRLTGGEVAVCRDIVQDAFILLWNRREQFSSLLGAQAFIYTTIKNKVWRHMRDTATQQRLLGSQPLADPDPDDEIAAAAEICAQIRGAVARLSPQARRAMELALQGMSVEQTSQVMGVTANTVKDLRKSAYRQLRKRLWHLRGFLSLIF